METELQQLAARVNQLEGSCIGCKTKLTSDVQYLSEGLKEAQRDVREIKDLIQTINKQISDLTVKVSLIVAVIVGAINFITPVIKDIITK